MNKQLNLLQVYRGLAALLVVLSHGNSILQREIYQDSFLKIFHFGWIGVDFFFVLSGFLIFYIHQYDIGQSHKFKSFIIKRFVRVYPLYWIVLTSKLAVSLFAKSNNGDQSYLFETVKAILLLPQDRDIIENLFIGVSWTLNHEIFFYFIFAIVILVKPKFSIPLVIAWVVGLLLNISNLIQLPEENFLLQFIFNERNLEFILGCIAAYVVNKYKFQQESLLFSISAFLLTVSIINTKNLEYNVSGISPVIAYGIPFMIIIIASVFLEKRKSINIFYILTYMGDSSYSIYLTHCFLISNIGKFVAKGNISWMENNFLYSSIMYLIIIILVLVIGWLIYAYIEKPLVAKLRMKIQPKI